MNAPLHDRLRNQLGKVPLGRGKSATAEGLDVLDKLAACPVLAEETAKGLRELIAATRLDRVDRVEFKRRLAEMPLDVAIGPHRPPSQPRRRSPMSYQGDIDKYEKPNEVLGGIERQRKFLASVARARMGCPLCGHTFNKYEATADSYSVDHVSDADETFQCPNCGLRVEFAVPFVGACFWKTHEEERDKFRRSKGSVTS